MAHSIFLISTSADAELSHEGKQEEVEEPSTEGQEELRATSLFTS